MIKGLSAQTYKADAERIWELITTTTDISWRPSVAAVSVADASSYSETNRRTRYATEFTITHDEPNVRRDMAVRHVDGSGTCTFALTANPDGSTTVEYGQQFDFNGPKLLQPLVSRFLSSERKTYLRDLGRALT